MVPSRFPRPIRLSLYALASAILLLLCVLPQDQLPDPGTGDKPEHAIAWFILTLTGYVLAPNRRWAIPAYALAFGVFIEILQATMGFGRHGDWRDFAVDTLGVAAAVAAFFGYRRWRAGRVVDAERAPL
jgi:VanZ family protein